MSTAHPYVSIGTVGLSVLVNRQLQKLDSRLVDIQAGVERRQRLRLDTSVARTIDSGGGITVTRSFHVVSPFSGVTDDLDDLDGGTEGDLVALLSASSSVTITVRSGVGNIISSSGSNLLLSDTSPAWFFYNGSDWCECIRTPIPKPTGGGKWQGSYQAISSATDTPVTWDYATYNPGGWVETTPPAGRYLVKVQLLPDAATTPLPKVWFRVNSQAYGYSAEPYSNYSGEQLNLAMILAVAGSQKIDVLVRGSTAFDLINHAAPDAYRIIIEQVAE